MPAPIAPAIRPSFAPSPGAITVGEFFRYKKTARKPPPIAQMKQQVLMIGITDGMPATTPPIRAALVLSFILFYTFTRGRFGKACTEVFGARVSPLSACVARTLRSRAV